MLEGQPNFDGRAARLTEKGWGSWSQPELVAAAASAISGVVTAW